MRRRRRCPQRRTSTLVIEALARGKDQRRGKVSATSRRVRRADGTLHHRVLGVVVMHVKYKTACVAVVTGGRDHEMTDFEAAVLTEQLARWRVTVLRHGNARGVDQ